MSEQEISIKISPERIQAALESEKGEKALIRSVKVVAEDSTRQLLATLSAGKES